MAQFRINFTDSGNMQVNFSDSNQMDATFGEYVAVVTSDYEKLTNLPSINSVTLLGDKTGPELHLQDEMDTITNLEIEALFA